MDPQQTRDSMVAAAVSHVCVMGATGLVGRAFCAALERAGIQVTRYSRGARPGFAHWDPDRGEIDLAPLTQAHAIVNLAGEGIADKRWTDARKRVIRESRVASTSLLANTLASLEVKPKVLLNASGVGFYGNRPDEAVWEDSTPGQGFLPEVCQAWEGAAQPAVRAGVRVVYPRFGLVLTPEGGILQRLLPIFRMGVGGRVGSGDQFMPWITLQDTVSALRFLIVSESISGPVNVVAPEPTTNEQFTDALARVLKRPAFLSVPRFALATVYGELGESLLEGANVRPRVLEQVGFRFDYPRLEDALDVLVGERRSIAP